ncbi:sigma-70 family RNA polymerase sigma factor [Singulisphaera sp. PoT]|uniref:sigma-70 family RNA polymerase sigma factor n=1 Tax=Singulisphaera sp. PoT TaxID=3411797 RepID=UPI003BF60BA3
MQPSRDATPDVGPRAGLLPRPRGPAPADDRVAALELLVREHEAGVRAFLRALGVNAAWVDDLAQETFLVAYRRLDDRDAERDAGPWLRGIARLLAANELRKAGRRSRLIARGLAGLLIARAEPDRETPSAEWIEAMRSCLRDLPEAARELLMRRYADDESAEAMAARLEVRADALRQKLLRLRQVIKQCVERKTGESWR